MAKNLGLEDDIKLIYEVQIYEYTYSKVYIRTTFVFSLLKNVFYSNQTFLHLDLSLFFLRSFDYGDRKIAPRTIAPNTLWIRVWVRVRIGGNLQGGNFPSTFDYVLKRAFLIFLFINITNARFFVSNSSLAFSRFLVLKVA